MTIGTSSCCASSVERDPAWHAAARWARQLAWASLVWMGVEGGVGLIAGLDASSVALVGWAIGSVVEGAASLTVVWRFSGERTLSATAERTAQRVVAASLWLLAVGIAIAAARGLAAHDEPGSSTLGIVILVASVVLMPLLGQAKQRLARRLTSRATASEGAQNLVCAAQGLVVLASLVVASMWSDGWWLDGAAGLVIAAWAAWEGCRAWRGEECC